MVLEVDDDELNNWDRDRGLDILDNSEGVFNYSSNLSISLFFMD